MSPGRFETVARVTRGGRTECLHFGTAAVVRPSGELTAACGDPRERTFARSVVKPVQVLPLLLAGGRQRYGLSSAEIALICASHSGAREHVDAVGQLLERAGLKSELLACGAHRPLDSRLAETMIRNGDDATVLHNNCSGKHTGMLMACQDRGWPLNSYLDFDHPLQLEITERLCQLTGEPSSELHFALDGCSAPTAHLSVLSVARLYGVLARPEAGLFGNDLAAALDTVFDAMVTAPQMVAGAGRFTTELMLATGGRILGKEGADGLYGVAVRGPEPLGVAIKIFDGGERCRDAVVLQVLDELGALDSAALERLQVFRRPQRKNHRDLVVGEIEAAKGLLSSC